MESGEKNSQEQEKIMEINTILWAEFLADPEARHMIIQEARENEYNAIKYRGQILWTNNDISSLILKLPD